MTFAMVYPGQGSQSIGMLSELAGEFSQIQSTFQEASDVLQYDLWNLVQNGPEEEINKTHITQPAMLVSDVAVWRVWQQEGGSSPAAMAGHSLGEYSALVCAESISLTDAALLVADRGKYMQEAVPEGVGAMAAILGLEDDVVVNVCSRAAEKDIVSAVNFNSPGQVVIAGNVEAVERAIDLANEAGAKRALKLPVSVPSHCSLMMSAADKLSLRLADININVPSIPVYNNVDVRSETDPDMIRDALKRQLFNPVRWVDTINSFAQQDIQRVVECGPGRVLMGLNKRINKKVKALATNDLNSFQNAIESVTEEG